MSEANHPNFHAVNFTTKIMKAFFESLRGKANKDIAGDISMYVADFALHIEQVVDDGVDLWETNERHNAEIKNSRCGS